MRVASLFCICLASWMGLLFCRRPFAMGVFVAAACVQGGLVYATARLAESGTWPLKASTLLVVALLLRVPFVVSPPVLSDDIYRYLFDGMVQVVGESPYARSPEHYASLLLPGQGGSTAKTILAELATKVNHPSLVTLYPPAAQFFFRLSAPLGMIGMKALLVTADMVVIALFLVASARGGPPLHRVILYAWNPLVVWEIAWSGHIDALALPFLLGATLLISSARGQKRAIWAGGLFAVAVWVKLIPVMFAPFLLLAAGRRAGWATLGGAVVSVFLVVPYMPQAAHALETLRVYGTTWEFSGFLFRTVRDVTGMNGLARLTMAALLAFAFSGLLYRQVRSPSSPGFFMGWAAFAWLLVTPTLHPWYGLYLAMCLPLMGAGRVGIVPAYLMTLTPLLGYNVLTDYLSAGVWSEGAWIPFWIFSVPVCALLVAWWKGKANA
ncbi:DUF2029 domain-containing protein [Desulfoluna spongiiphila]|uniref:DUF2029 domain-containing protein n=1 Tax=Desulfoluna spongiiphila TaxID=419481 RepID=UPI00186A4154|nr:DUF2029 domain-containing protein [Desulfoluna spongiiphila]